MKVGIYTLGCKVNTYESEYVSSIFKSRGYTISDYNDKCDIYVINTCTVTNIADRKSRQMLRRAKQVSPNAIIVAVRMLCTNPQRTSSPNRRNRFSIRKQRKK